MSKYLIPLFHLLNFCISTRPADQILSIPYEITLLFGNLRRTGLCRAFSVELEQIHKKNLTQAPPRLQRMLLCIQPYDCVIQYLPGRKMVTADALSHLLPLDKHEIPDMQVKVHHLVRITPVKL